MKQINSEILNKKYFIFDIDGTLVDSMGMWNMIDQKILSEAFGVQVTQADIKIFRDSVLYDEKNVGGDIYSLYNEALVNYFNLGITALEFDELRNNVANYLSVNELDYKKGAGKFLIMLKNLGKKIGIATTTTKKQYSIYEDLNMKMINKAPLKQLVDSTVLCEDVSRKKPDPEAYLLVMEKLGAKPHECIVFEDSLNGIISAKDAGIDVVAVYDESAQNEQDVIDKIADYKVESFEELIKILGLDKVQNQPE